MSLLLAAALISSCASYEGPSGSDAHAFAAPAAKSSSERIIRKDGNMAMRSCGLEDSVTKCVALVEAHHGILQNANLTEDDILEGRMKLLRSQVAAPPSVSTSTVNASPAPWVPSPRALAGR